MARQKGSANFAGTLEVLAGGPIDSRSIVPTLADLTVASNFPYPYQYMEVRVTATGKKYKLVGNDLTVAANWVEIEETGGSQITVDSALSTTSENPVQNKVITTEINKKANATALDSKADLVDGKVPAGQLPSYVDDVIEGYARDDGMLYTDVITKLNQVTSSNVSYSGNATAKCSSFVANKAKNGSTPIFHFYGLYRNPGVEAGNFIVGGTAESPTVATDVVGNFLQRYNDDAQIICNGGNFAGFNGAVQGVTALSSAADGLFYAGKVQTDNFSGTVTELEVAHHYSFFSDAQMTQVITPETGKIYVDIPSGRTFRWSGSDFVVIGSDLALGETSSTAYRGDRGKVAYETSQANAAAIGDLSTLTTTDKTDVVSAVNELESEKLKGDVLTAQDIEDIKAAFQANVSQQWIMTQHFNRDNIFSTDEKLVGCWIDGKPVYKKVLKFKTPSSANTMTYTNIGASVDTAISYYATFKGTAGTWIFADSNSDPNGYRASAQVNSNSHSSEPNRAVIVFGANAISSWFNLDVYFIVYYTKTTDAANSFKLADENDYSTTEHVVGTWIDGKPVYQKTVDFGSGPNASTKTVNHGISNFKHAVDIKAIGIATNNSTCWTLNWYEASSGYICIAADPTKISMTASKDQSSAYIHYYVTLKYLKTTD